MSTGLPSPQRPVDIGIKDNPKLRIEQISSSPVPTQPQTGPAIMESQPHVNDTVSTPTEGDEYVQLSDTKTGTLVSDSDSEREDPGSAIQGGKWVMVKRPQEGRTNTGFSESSSSMDRDNLLSGTTISPSTTTFTAPPETSSHDEGGTQTEMRSSTLKRPASPSSDFDIDTSDAEPDLISLTVTETDSSPSSASDIEDQNIGNNDPHLHSPSSPHAHSSTHQTKKRKTEQDPELAATFRAFQEEFLSSMVVCEDGARGRKVGPPEIPISIDPSLAATFEPSQEYILSSIVAATGSRKRKTGPPETESEADPALAATFQAFQTEFMSSMGARILSLEADREIREDGRVVPQSLVADLTQEGMQREDERMVDAGPSSLSGSGSGSGSGSVAGEEGKGGIAMDSGSLSEVKREAGGSGVRPKGDSASVPGEGVKGHVETGWGTQLDTEAGWGSPSHVKGEAMGCGGGGDMEVEEMDKDRMLDDGPSVASGSVADEKGKGKMIETGWGSPSDVETGWGSLPDVKSEAIVWGVGPKEKPWGNMEREMVRPQAALAPTSTLGGNPSGSWYSSKSPPESNMIDGSTMLKLINLAKANSLSTDEALIRNFSDYRILRKSRVPIACYEAASTNKKGKTLLSIVAELVRLLTERKGLASAVETLVLDFGFREDKYWKPVAPLSALNELVSRCDRVKEVWVKVGGTIPGNGGLTACLEGRLRDADELGGENQERWSTIEWGLIDEYDPELPCGYVRSLSRMHTLTIDATATKPGGHRNILYWCSVELPTSDTIAEYGLHILNHGRVGEYRSLEKLNIWGTDIDVLTRMRRFATDPSCDIKSDFLHYAYSLRSLHLKNVKFVWKGKDKTGFRMGSLVDVLGRVGNLEFIRLDKVGGLGEEELVAALKSHRGTLTRLELVDIDFSGTSSEPEQDESQLISAFDVLYGLEVIQLSRIRLSPGSSLEDLLARMCCPALTCLTLGRGPPNVPRPLYTASTTASTPAPAPASTSAPASKDVVALLPEAEKFVTLLPGAEMIFDFMLGIEHNREPTLTIVLEGDGQEHRWNPDERDIIAQACDARGVRWNFIDGV